MLNKIKENILDILFPKSCVLCGRLGEFLCQDCARQSIEIKTQSCPRCNKITRGGKFCPRCLSRSSLNGVLASSYFVDPTTKELIHAYKYDRIRDIHQLLAAKMIKKIAEQNLKFDIVTFVPLSRKRFAWRGFNQTELLAQEVAKHFGKPLLAGIEKKKDTKTQMGLSGKERRENLTGAFIFRGDKSALRDKKIILIDDVYTTGATLEAIAKILRDAGARSVFGVVVAKE